MLRKLFATLIALAFVAPAAAGELEGWVELARKDLQNAKQAILTEVMDFSTVEAEGFWPLYREYQTETAGLGDRKIALLKGYANDFDTMDGVKAKALFDQSVALQEDRLGLMKKYYKKFAKVVGPTKAARVMQVENQLNTLVDLQVMSETPLIEAAEIAPAAPK